MKPTDDIEELFTSLEDQWDDKEPETGHHQRFLNKLGSIGTPETKKSTVPIWKYISIAASLALLITIGVQFFQQGSTPNQHTVEIPEEAPKKPMEVERTEFYFTTLITKEIEKIDAISGPKTKQLVDDLKSQLTRLESDYKSLESDLQSRGDAKQILNAMIINFQTRINLSQEVLDKIKKIEQLKNTKHEKYTI